MHTMLALAPGLLATATPRDTTITVRGILQIQLDSAGRPAAAILVLPEPVTLVGSSVNSLMNGAGRAPAPFVHQRLVL